MTPGARIQAAIEVLDAVIAAARSEGAPADRLIADYFKTRRYAGSKDRRAVREHVYAAIRAVGPVPPSGRAAMLTLAADDPALAALFDGTAHSPAAIAPGEAAATAGIAPAWLVDALTASGLTDDVMAAMLGRAPLDLRVNTLKADRAALALPEPGELLAAPQGLRFAPGTPVEQWEAYREGLVEVQDHGSQLACLAAAARPGETVVDLCAGAGGKSLALAAAMAGEGTLIACDTDRARLAKLPPRAERAGAGMIETRLLAPRAEDAGLADVLGRADLALVDAPCSGTGTWRRKPEAKWRLTPERLARFAAVQDHLLDCAAALPRSGGRLVYITCSLLDAEGAERIDAFLARHPGWRAEPLALPLGRGRGAGWRLDPYHDAADGFFIASLRSP